MYMYLCDYTDCYGLLFYRLERKLKYHNIYEGSQALWWLLHHKRYLNVCMHVIGNKSLYYHSVIWKHLIF